MGGGVAAARQPLELLGPGSNPGPPVRPFRPGRMRTSVRVQPAAIHGGAGTRRDRGVAVLQRGAAPPGHAGRGWQPPDAAEVRRGGLAHPGRPLRPACVPARAARAGPGAAVGGVPDRPLVLQPWLAQAPPVLGGSQAAPVRAVRRRGDVAGKADVVDARPRQRRGRRQPAREPPHRLPELRRDARHALRAQQAARVRGAAPRSSDPSLPRPAVLLAGVLDRVGGGERGPPASPARRAAAVRAARRRGGGARLGRRRAPGTGCPTTPCASGSAATSGSARRDAPDSDIVAARGADPAATLRRRMRTRLAVVTVAALLLPATDGGRRAIR